MRPGRIARAGLPVLEGASCFERDRPTVCRAAAASTNVIPAGAVWRNVPADGQTNKKGYF